MPNMNSHLGIPAIDSGTDPKPKGSQTKSAPKEVSTTPMTPPVGRRINKRSMGIPSIN